MALERHLAELDRLNLERIRDLLFESRVILLELRRARQFETLELQSLEAEVSALESQSQDVRLERALELRSRARAYYPEARASIAL